MKNNSVSVIKSGIDINDDFDIRSMINKAAAGKYVKKVKPGDKGINGRKVTNEEIIPLEDEILNDLVRLMCVIIGVKPLYGVKTLGDNKCFKIEYLSKNEASTCFGQINITDKYNVWSIYNKGNNKNRFMKSKIKFCSNKVDAFSFFSGYSYNILKSVNMKLINLYLNHIKEVICRGNITLYNYVLNWCANIIQNPNVKNEVALVIFGKQGSGKNLFTDVLCKLIDRYSDGNVGKIIEVLGKFNEKIENRKLIVLNDLSGKDINTFLNFDAMKEFMTGKTVEIKAKKDSLRTVDNVLNFILVSDGNVKFKNRSNGDRYALINVSDWKINNLKYFSNLAKSLDDNYFYDNLLTFFMKRNISKFNPMKIVSSGNIELPRELTKDSDGSDVFMFFYDKFNEFCEGYKCAAAYNDYCKYCNDNELKPIIKKYFNEHISETCDKTRKNINGVRTWVYITNPEYGYIETEEEEEREMFEPIVFSKQVEQYKNNNKQVNKEKVCTTSYSKPVNKEKVCTTSYSKPVNSNVNKEKVCTTSYSKPVNKEKVCTTSYSKPVNSNVNKEKVCTTSYNKLENKKVKTSNDLIEYIASKNIKLNSKKPISLYFAVSDIIEKEIKSSSREVIKYSLFKPFIITFVDDKDKYNIIGYNKMKRFLDGVYLIYKINNSCKCMKSINKQLDFMRINIFPKKKKFNDVVYYQQDITKLTESEYGSVKSLYNAHREEIKQENEIEEQQLTEFHLSKLDASDSDTEHINNSDLPGMRMDDSIIHYIDSDEYDEYNKDGDYDYIDTNCNSDLMYNSSDDDAIYPSPPKIDPKALTFFPSPPKRTSIPNKIPLPNSDLTHNSSDDDYIPSTPKIYPNPPTRISAPSAKYLKGWYNDSLTSSDEELTEDIKKNEKINIVSDCNKDIKKVGFTSVKDWYNDSITSSDEELTEQQNNEDIKNETNSNDATQGSVSRFIQWCANKLTNQSEDIKKNEKINIVSDNKSTQSNDCEDLIDMSNTLIEIPVTSTDKNNNDTNKYIDFNLINKQLDEEKKKLENQQIKKLKNSPIPVQIVLLSNNEEIVKTLPPELGITRKNAKTRLPTLIKLNYPELTLKHYIIDDIIYFI